MQALDASIPDPPALKLALVAGESSGDQIGAAVLSSLFKRGLNLSVQGVGGPALASAGTEAFAAAPSTDPRFSAVARRCFSGGRRAGL
ncbi:MAG: hypothetical protein EBZ42_00010 [Betaproteobacteria bacterium]|nr:hypothetical protein [Betaproteobacteria bacterium]